jgi:hypothetical protein
LVFKSSGVVGLIYAIFAKAGFLLKLTLNGKSKKRLGLTQTNQELKFLAQSSSQLKQTKDLLLNPLKRV